MVLQLTSSDIEHLARLVKSNFQEVSARYDYAKYSPKDYERFKQVFEMRTANNSDIKNALVWKWGHAGKDNFPIKQQELIDYIIKLWPRYLKNHSRLPTPLATYTFWMEELHRSLNSNSRRYITAAYLTHLLHNKVTPIIDQHNYRALATLLQKIRPTLKFKKKPSNWQDIEILNYFMESLCQHLNYSKGDLDKYLMMYGRYYCDRS